MRGRPKTCTVGSGSALLPPLCKVSRGIVAQQGSCTFQPSRTNTFQCAGSQRLPLCRLARSGCAELLSGCTATGHHKRSHAGQHSAGVGVGMAHCKQHTTERVAAVCARVLKCTVTGPMQGKMQHRKTSAPSATQFASLMGGSGYLCAGTHKVHQCTSAAGRRARHVRTGVQPWRHGRGTVYRTSVDHVRWRLLRWHTRRRSVANKSARGRGSRGQASWSPLRGGVLTC